MLRLLTLAFAIAAVALNLRDNLDDFLDNLDKDELFNDGEYNEDDEFTLDEDIDDYMDDEDDDFSDDEDDEDEYDLQQITTNFSFSQDDKVSALTPEAIFDSAERLLVEVQVPAFSGLRDVK
ncbi:hypothetical protein EIN_226810 [Entamoeba invadens IP1]|uniref:Uncharacterized protein n=1 Tax=Entamoeba invadens IP1 TaxID=370355 RepID=A0A0A1U8I7_ENTIV|nr:hypothetical protein EIN_226810 [Entamoeba invadens IP1]ELP88298.1 hypothetical protein EIN_226810 [Entamoeba invadens IP1]|eukprot:XP_004255069.1 hypothetical protein EIN_226810 [Entamoeba invadens IP1]